METSGNEPAQGENHRLLFAQLGLEATSPPATGKTQRSCQVGAGGQPEGTPSHCSCGRLPLPRELGRGMVGGGAPPAFLSPHPTPLTSRSEAPLRPAPSPTSPGHRSYRPRVAMATWKGHLDPSRRGVSSRCFLHPSAFNWSFSSVHQGRFLPSHASSSCCSSVQPHRQFLLMSNLNPS